ncbi:nucleotidyltransferase substrate binding protein [bacterium]|nr:nucleotidyltransferase substrate binding protein [bacterium]
MDKDIRWIQRFEKYIKALGSLTGDIELASKRELSDIERRGLIQAFEYTYELAWNTIKDFYQSIGETDIQGSRDAFRIAFNRGLVKNKDLIKTVKSRQITCHTYNEETATEIFQDVFDKYYDAFKELEASLQGEKEKRK